MVTASVEVPDTIRVIFQSIFKVSKKMRFANEGMIWVDPKKGDIFRILNKTNSAFICPS